MRLFGVGFIGADKTLDAFVSARSRSPLGIDLANMGDEGCRPRLGFKQTAGLSRLRLGQSTADYERAETAPLIAGAVALGIWQGMYVA
ncbi:MAG: hypothetical protein JO049_14975 [Hyphomicrobiales bacterium]|nr:hypothetical protein [Hyphomicrobiales bacterium]